MRISYDNRLEGLVEITNYICSELDKEKLIEQIVEKASYFTDSERGTLFLYDQYKDELYTEYGSGLSKNQVRISNGIAYYVAQTGNPYISNDPYLDSLFNSDSDKELGFKTKSILAVPVFSRYHELIGVIEVINKKSTLYNTSDLQFLSTFSKYVSTSISNALLFEEVNNFKEYQNDLIENLDNGILTTDLDGNIKLVNKKACDILGVEKNSLLDFNVQSEELKEFAFLKKSYLYTLRNQPYSKSNLELNNFGNNVIFDLNTVAIKSTEGNVTGVINIFKDLTKEFRVKQNLKRYMPDHVIKDVLEKNDLSLFNGKIQRGSIVFTDLRGFTSLTESLGPTQIVSLINQFFDEMVSSVFKFNGTVDKFIGDAIMAVFGIPLTGDQDALRAVNCALDMLENLRKFNAFRPEKLKLKVGIGISTGEVITGNFGSSQRFECTVMGDPVNIASRLQELTKEYPNDLLFCEKTYKDVKNAYSCRLVDSVKVKGKKGKMNIYTLK